MTKDYNDNVHQLQWQWQQRHWLTTKDDKKLRQTYNDRPTATKCHARNDQHVQQADTIDMTDNYDDNDDNNDDDNNDDNNNNDGKDNVDHNKNVND